MALGDTSIDQRHDRTIRAWVLALLRYAITLDDEDRLVALAAASEIDRSGSRQSGDFHFFHRTSAELCEAVAHPRPDNRHLLRRHLERLSDQRVKRAFAAIFDLDQAITDRAALKLRQRKRPDSWEGTHNRKVQG